MSIIQLRILKPEHQTNFSDSAPVLVQFQGEVTERPETAGSLFFNWYSSLNVAPESDPTNVMLNQSGDDPFNFTKPLSVGSHVLTFVAKDQPGNDLPALQAVQTGGTTGGPPREGVEHPCVIHVFVALIRAPARNASLSRANVTLQATAPHLWGDKDYQAINQIQYRWRFEPRGNPSGRRSHSFIPNPLTFNADLSIVEYRGVLANQIDTGNYTLILRVEHTQDPTIGHETSIPVRITA